MAESRLIDSYPVIGIRPTIDGRRGKIKVRESLEDQTMNMAKSAAKLIEENVFYSNGEHVKVIIADTTIGRVAEAAACEDRIFPRAEKKITTACLPPFPIRITGSRSVRDRSAQADSTTCRKWRRSMQSVFISRTFVS